MVQSGARVGLFGEARGKEDDTNVSSKEGVTFHGGYVYLDGVKIGDNETSSCFFFFDSAAPCSCAILFIQNFLLWSFLLSLLLTFLVSSFLSTCI